jgi:methionyl-tRNA synthetase
LTAFTEQLQEWLKDKAYWRPNVLNFTTQFIAQGLQDRAITRDISWGVPIPLEGWEDRRIYVWFEAVIGYLSASKEWAHKQGAPERWRDFWQKECRAYYFMGKDNIPFHTIIWPAMLMGYRPGELPLPHDVLANEFVTLEGQKLSTSGNWAVWIPDYLAQYDPDPLRYCLAATMPETSDSDFTWREFVRRNNNELVGTYGNLVHRVLTLTQRHYQGRMPDPGPALDPRSRELLALSEAAFGEADRQLSACHFRAALGVNMGLARDVNRYLEEKAPWQTVRTDPGDAARTLHVALVAISALRTLMYPFLPFSSQELHETLGFAGTVQELGWRLQSPAVGQQMRPPRPLFTKLDEEEVVQREVGRLGTKADA